MDAGTTGVVVNLGGVSLIVSNTNDDTIFQTEEIELFSVALSPTPVTKTGAAHQLFTVPPLSVITRTFNITGFPAFEVQLALTPGTSSSVAIFTVDAAGNLIAAHRVLDKEETVIASLTPIP